ncbi:MAG: DUF898 family protein, partial [Clostridia bacterium]|nr:DUF898 family protein [Clostridia bacterium]
MNAYNTQTNPSPASSYFDGKTIQHIGWNLLAFFLTVITAGIAYPWAMCMSMRWEVKHTVINGRRLKFTGNGAQLFGKYILWLFLALITAGIYLIWLTISVAKWKAKHTVYEDDPDGESFFDGGVAGWFFQRLLVGFLTIITLGIYFAWGKKRLIAWVTKHTVICGDRLTFVGTGGEFFVRYLLYLLLTPLTLGIYALFFPVRMLKWQYSRTFVAQEEAPRYFAAPAAQTRTAPSGWGNPYAAQQQPQPQRKKLSAGAIIALVICGILALTLFAFVGYMIYLHANGIEFSWPWERGRVSTEELVPGVNIPVTEHSTVYISDNSGQPGSPESEYTRYMIVHDDGTTLVTGEGIISGLHNGACVVAVGEPSGGFQRILAIDGDGVLREGLYPLEKLERLLVGVTVEQLYVRSGPGMEYDILGTIDAGQRILVTGGELHGWYPVNCVVIEGGTVTGYSFGEYITFEGDFEAKEPWEGVTADASDPAPVYLVANSGQTVEPDPDPIEESRPEQEVSSTPADPGKSAAEIAKELDLIGNWVAALRSDDGNKMTIYSVDINEDGTCEQLDVFYYNDNYPAHDGPENTWQMPGYGPLLFYGTYEVLDTAGNGALQLILTEDDKTGDTYDDRIDFRVISRAGDLLTVEYRENGGAYHSQNIYTLVFTQ